MNSASPRYSIAVRVYWEDTDAGGIVFYANHLKYFERARTEWLRSLGFEQERMRREAGTLFVVAETSIRYHRPARLDDLLDVDVAVVEAGRASLKLAQSARRGGELLSDATIRLGCVDMQTMRPVRIPESILRELE
jgi:acyl-CoA thioester hydrolase